MTMRNYLVTIHEDGSVSAVEYEDPEKVLKAAQRAAFRLGYMAALFESRKKVQEFRERRNKSREANLMYAAVASVHGEVAARMDSYLH